MFGRCKRPPTQRQLTSTPNGFSLSHEFGYDERLHDTDLDAYGEDNHFALDLSRCTGRDRDNYDSYADADIELNDEEAKELLLALTVWLESRA